MQTKTAPSIKAAIIPEKKPSSVLFGLISLSKGVFPISDPPIYAKESVNAETVIKSKINIEFLNSKIWGSIKTNRIEIIKLVKRNWINTEFWNEMNLSLWKLFENKKMLKINQNRLLKWIYIPKTILLLTK